MVAVKGCKISDWNGRSLGCISSSQVIENPDCADAHRLRGWYDTTGHSTQFRGYTSDGSSGSGSSGMCLSNHSSISTVQCMTNFIMLPRFDSLPLVC